MNISRFKQIIEFSTENKKNMESRIRDFYAYAQMENDKELLKPMQIARPLFEKKDYIIVEMPFADKEIGALCYRGDSIGYTFLNTSLPKVNVNFALCHEIYHIFFQETELQQKVELLNEHYYEYQEEFSANLFASMLLMPEQSYCPMFHKFRSEAKEGEDNLALLVKLMNYFEVPYMAALIRCYELGLLESGKTLEELMNVDVEAIRSMFQQIWLDESILDATKKDDYERFEMLVKYFGHKYQEEEYISEKAVDTAVRNMQALYRKIKGD